MSTYAVIASNYTYCHLLKVLLFTSCHNVLILKLVETVSRYYISANSNIWGFNDSMHFINAEHKTQSTKAMKNVAKTLQ